MLILAVVGIIINMVWFWYVCPRLMHNYWFERGIIVFGMFCGVMATGVTLLRIVDPENKTEALEDTGIACTLMGFWDLFQIGMYPIFIGMGHTLLTGSLILLGAVATFILMRIVKCWHKPTTYRSEE